MLKPFTACTGIAAPIMRNNVDTDLIIRIERIAQLKRGQLGRWAFEALRYRADGSEDDAFVLNQEPFRKAQILISGANFGCGSSREMAVWALEECGIRCIIAESYGDIFFNNCFQNDILPVTLPAPQVAALSAIAAAGGLVTVSLLDCTVSAVGMEPIAFQIPPPKRDALLNGLDEIGQTLTLASEIARFQARDKVARPWVHLPQHRIDTLP